MQYTAKSSIFVTLFVRFVLTDVRKIELLGIKFEKSSTNTQKKQCNIAYKLNKIELFHHQTSKKFYFRG